METAGPVSTESVRFGVLLKHYRVAAGLSQEELAERARLSARAISAYERGQRQAPYRDTVALLVQALGLSPEEATTLEATVPRRRGPAGAPTQSCCCSLGSRASASRGSCTRRGHMLVRTGGPC
jgi:DNA-binding XRE family transcriptional regulator